VWATGQLWASSDALAWASAIAWPNWSAQNGSPGAPGTRAAEP
jgi:hypothetical protein